MRMIIDARGQYFPDQEAFAELARQVDHDIRSPLTAICSYAECLAWLTTLDLATREKYARAIVAEARRLGRMGTYFVSLVTPQPEQNLQEICLAEIVSEVLDELRDLLELQESEVVLNKPERAVPLIWPRETLRQIIMGTLESLIEWGGSRSRLELTLSDGGGSDLSLAAELINERDVECDASRFGYRSALALLQSHGGKLDLLTDAAPHLCLHMPYVGRMKSAASETPIERSA